MGDVDVLDAPPEKAAPALEYKADPGRVSVRGFRLLLVLTLVNTTLLGASVMGPQLFPFLRQQWTQWRAERAKRQAEAAAQQAAAAKKQLALSLQQQCLAFSRPADMVVYDEDPAENARRLREGSKDYANVISTPSDAPPGWIPPTKAVMPDVYVDYQRARGVTTFGGPNEGLVFLHGLKSPAGVPYLVTAHIETVTNFGTRYVSEYTSGKTLRIHTQSKRRQLSVSAAAAGDVTTSPKRLSRQLTLVLPDTSDRTVARFAQQPDAAHRPPVDYGNVLRLYAGQPDPADPTHFTIPYRLDGREGVIDGWLKEDRIELKPREGEWLFDRGEAWMLPPPPGRPLNLYPAPSAGDPLPNE